MALIVYAGDESKGGIQKLLPKLWSWGRICNKPQA